MKNTIKYMILALAGVLTLAVSCQREALLPGPGDAPDGYRTVEFYAQVPDMDKVQTKAVDPDGAGVQQMTVFCFDANSFFITGKPVTCCFRVINLFKKTAENHTCYKF